MTEQQKQKAGIAVVSLVLGILGLILLGPLASIPAVICGHIARSRIKKNPDTLAGGGMALAGLVMGYVQIAVMLVLLPLLAATAIPSIARARDLAQQNACISNLRMLENAKDMATMERQLASGDAVSENEISDHVGGSVSGLVCPAGGHYTIHPVGQHPACSKHGTIAVPVNTR